MVLPLTLVFQATVNKNGSTIGSERGSHHLGTQTQSGVIHLDYRVQVPRRRPGSNRRPLSCHGPCKILTTTLSTCALAAERDVRVPGSEHGAIDTDRNYKVRVSTSPVREHRVRMCPRYPTIREPELALRARHRAHEITTNRMSRRTKKTLRFRVGLVLEPIRSRDGIGAHARSLHTCEIGTPSRFHASWDTTIRRLQPLCSVHRRESDQGSH